LSNIDSQSRYSSFHRQLLARSKPATRLNAVPNLLQETEKRGSKESSISTSAHLDAGPRHTPVINDPQLPAPDSPQQALQQLHLATVDRRDISDGSRIPGSYVYHGILTQKYWLGNAQRPWASAGDK